MTGLVRRVAGPQGKALLRSENANRDVVPRVILPRVKRWTVAAFLLAAVFIVPPGLGAQAASARQSFTAPAAPTAVSAVAGNRMAVVSWDAPTGAGDDT